MPRLRESVKRALPKFVHNAVIQTRRMLAAPPLEDIVLHGYDLVADPCDRRRLNLVIPSIAPKKAFGGVVTALEVFLTLGARVAADLRIVIDEFEPDPDLELLSRSAQSIGLDLARIEVTPRTSQTPRLSVRTNDLFMSCNWWTTLNIRALLNAQEHEFGGRRRPLLYLIQEYEPLFFAMSSTHMLTRLAFQPIWPCWGLFNSSELATFFESQGHKLTRAFVFEPALSSAMRPFLEGPPPTKVRRLLVYGRPSVPRNCFPAIESGLRLWAEKFPEFRAWEVVSVGLSHGPIRLATGRFIKSLGKLDLAAYGQILRESAVGVSLMASPHPSYPPLEMAHFGLRTVTNSYANKNLSLSHPNIISIDDISPDRLADAVAESCRAFEAAPAAGWRAQSLRPSFLDSTPLACLEGVALALEQEVWRSQNAPRGRGTES